jgi:hypothetical protein
MMHGRFWQRQLILGAIAAWSTTKFWVKQIHKFDILSLICKNLLWFCCIHLSSPIISATAAEQNMAPSFDTLSDHDFQEEDEEEEIDFSDLREQYDVRMEEGLDTFVVCLRNEALPHLADHWSTGRRWLANRQHGTTAETVQISSEEA